MFWKRKQPQPPAQPPAPHAPTADQIIDLGDGYKGKLQVKMGNKPKVFEHRNVPDHLLDSKAPTVLFDTDIWMITPDADPCTIQEAINAISLALAKIPGFTAAVFKNHCGCDPNEDA